MKSDSLVSRGMALLGVTMSVHVPSSALVTAKVKTDDNGFTAEINYSYTYPGSLVVSSSVFSVPVESKLHGVAVCSSVIRAFSEGKTEWSTVEADAAYEQSERRVRNEVHGPGC